MDMTQHNNKTKDKSHVVISVEAPKALDQVQHQFPIRTLNRVGIEEIDLNTAKAIYDNLPLTSYSMVQR